MEIKCVETPRIEDGLHQGVISQVTFRSEPYAYTDLLISMFEGRVVMKVGFPTIVSVESGLGKLLGSFGVRLVMGSSYDPEKLLVGQKVQFVTVKQKSSKDGKEYARVVKESIKPFTNTGV